MGGIRQTEGQKNKIGWLGREQQTHQYRYRGHAKDEQWKLRHEPKEPVLHDPAVHDQRGRIGRAGDPGVLTHPVLWKIDEGLVVCDDDDDGLMGLAVTGLPGGATTGFSRQNAVCPSAAQQRREHVTYRQTEV